MMQGYVKFGLCEVVFTCECFRWQRLLHLRTRCLPARRPFPCFMCCLEGGSCSMAIPGRQASHTFDASAQCCITRGPPQGVSSDSEPVLLHLEPCTMCCYSRVYLVRVQRHLRVPSSFGLLQARSTAQFCTYHDSFPSRYAFNAHRSSCKHGRLAFVSSS